MHLNHRKRYDESSTVLVTYQTKRQKQGKFGLFWSEFGGAYANMANANGESAVF